MADSSKSLLTIDELAQASGIAIRTLRYYVSIGLIDKPTGETRGARYDARHLEQIRNVRELQAQGLTLNRILEIRKQTLQEHLEKRTIGEPVTRIEIAVDKGVSAVFMKELCNLTKNEMIEIANELAIVLANKLKEKKNGRK